MYSSDMRARIIAGAAGLVVKSLEFVEEESDLDGTVTPSYWVMTFTDRSEISFRFMAELVGRP